MKALSFSNPWLWATLHAGKLVENRSWAPPIAMIDQRIALHAAASWDAKPFPTSLLGRASFTPIGFLIAHGFDPPSRRALYATGRIVATAVIDRVVTEDRTLPQDQRKWLIAPYGPYGWLLRDLRILHAPVVATGKLGLWELSDRERASVEELGGGG